MKIKGFTVQKSPKGIEATSSSNIINSDNDSGVQLELTTGQRALFFKDKQLDQNIRKRTQTITHIHFTNLLKQLIKALKMHSSLLTPTLRFQ